MPFMSRHKTEKGLNNNNDKIVKSINSDVGNFSNYWICPKKNIVTTHPERKKG